MTTSTLTDTDVVRALFRAFADADLAALGDLLHADATWHHRNDDRLGGVHRFPEQRSKTMSAEQNIQTTRQMYEAFGRGDVQAVLGLVTDDVDWSTDAAIESAPWYGPRRGKDGVASRWPSPVTMTGTSWCSSATHSPPPPPAGTSR